MGKVFTEKLLNDDGVAAAEPGKFSKIYTHGNYTTCRLLNASQWGQKLSITG